MKQCDQNCKFCERANAVHRKYCKNETAIIIYSDYYCKINYKDYKDLQDENISIQEEICRDNKNCKYYEDKYEWDLQQQKIIQKRIEEEERKKQKEISYWKDYYSRHEWHEWWAGNIFEKKEYLEQKEEQKNEQGRMA